MIEPGSDSRIPGAVARAVRKLRDGVSLRFGPRFVEMRLFGSYARGDWGPDSDVDLLVVVEGLEERERREVFDLATDVYFDTMLHLAPLVLSRQELEHLRAREMRLAAEIDADGIPV